MQGLTVIVASADRERFRSGLELAAANSALDRPTRIFLQGSAASLLQQVEAASQAGTPTLRELLEETIAVGATIAVCQSGLALAGMRADELPEGVETSGLVQLLSSGRDHQIVMV